MRKGTTALRNIQLLKWCRRVRRRASTGTCSTAFPARRATTTTRCWRLLPAIRFLGPPAACGPIRLDRFSPYLRRLRRRSAIATSGRWRPTATSIRSRRDALARIAYYFDFAYAAGDGPGEAARQLLVEEEDWWRGPDQGTLPERTATTRSLALDDTRRDAHRVKARLRGAAARHFSYCDEIRGLYRRGTIGPSRRRNTRQYAVNELRPCSSGWCSSRSTGREESLYLSLGLTSRPLNRTADGRRAPGDVDGRWTDDTFGDGDGWNGRVGWNGCNAAGTARSAAPASNRCRGRADLRDHRIKGSLRTLLRCHARADGRGGIHVAEARVVPETRSRPRRTRPPSRRRRHRHLHISARFRPRQPMNAT